MRRQTDAQLHALAVSVAIIAVCAPYIWISGKLATNSAATLEQLAALELRKGLAFVGFIALAAYAATLIALRRIQRREQALSDARTHMLIAERRALAGIFAAAVAHDARNLLTVVGLELDSLDRRTIDPEARTALTAARSATISLASALSLLMSSGKTALGHEQTGELATEVHKAIGLARAHLSVRHCDLRVDVMPVTCQFVPTLIHHILVNLVVNAGEAQDGRGRIEVAVRSVTGPAPSKAALKTPLKTAASGSSSRWARARGDGGSSSWIKVSPAPPGSTAGDPTTAPGSPEPSEKTTASVETAERGSAREQASALVPDRGRPGQDERPVPASPQQYAVIEVHDAGPGVDPSLGDRLFEPYATTKDSGTGLGLWSVRECARLLGGEVEVARSPLGGACFRVWLGYPQAS